MAFLLSLEGIHRRDLDTGAKLFAALGQPVLMHGARPTRDQVHSSGPWDGPSLEWSTMPVSSRGPRRRRSWWCHTPLINPQHPHACEAGGVIRCGSQTRLDMGPHGIPRSCQLSSQASDGGSFEAQLSDLPADRPRPADAPEGRTSARYVPGISPSGRRVRDISSTVLCHRNLAGTPAQGASITSTTTRPWPCAITPQPGQPAQRSQDSMSSTRVSGVRATLIRWKPSKPTSRSHRTQRSSDTQQQQGGPDTARGP